MYLDDHPPIAGGRELWGFPKKLASPRLEVEIDTLVGTLDYGKVRIAPGTMGYKHRCADRAAVQAGLAAPNYLLKIIPHVDGTGFRGLPYDPDEADPGSRVYALKSFPMNLSITLESMRWLLQCVQAARDEVVRLRPELAGGRRIG
jgi:hypothetical protein